MARSINYTKAVVICHGKSEYQISRYIYTNLRLPVKLHAKDKGKHSIQIPGLIQELSTSVFTNIKTFSEHFNVEVKSRNKCLESFKRNRQIRRILKKNGDGRIKSSSIIGIVIKKNEFSCFSWHSDKYP